MHPVGSRWGTIDDQSVVSSPTWVPQRNLLSYSKIVGGLERNVQIATRALDHRVAAVDLPRHRTPVVGRGEFFLNIDWDRSIGHERHTWPIDWGAFDGDCLQPSHAIGSEARCFDGVG